MRFIVELDIVDADDGRRIDVDAKWEADRLQQLIATEGGFVIDEDEDDEQCVCYDNVRVKPE